jgi:hypothetical protein
MWFRVVCSGLILLVVALAGGWLLLWAMDFVRDTLPPGINLLGIAFAGFAVLEVMNRVIDGIQAVAGRWIEAVLPSSASDA